MRARRGKRESPGWRVEARPRRVEVFYAYPSRPESLDEIITNALKDLSSERAIQQARVRFRPWPDISITGTRLIDQITDTINRSDVFACDLTYPNLNVAFELGYAIGKFKRLWISLDSAIEDAANRYKRSFEGIIGAGYTGYENHRDLVDAFLYDRPWASLGDHVLNDSYRKRAPRPEIPTLLYVKPPPDTEAVIASLELTG